MAVQTRLHDGVAAADVLAQDGLRVVFAQEVDDFGVAGRGGEHERGLVVIVQCGGALLVAELDEDLADGEMAEGGGEVEVRVRIPADGMVGVVEEVGMGAEDALDEKVVVYVDCAPKADRGINPT